MSYLILKVSMFMSYVHLKKYIKVNKQKYKRNPKFSKITALCVIK